MEVSNEKAADYSIKSMMADEVPDIFDLIDAPEVVISRTEADDFCIYSFNGTEFQSHFCLKSI